MTNETEDDIETESNVELRRSKNRIGRPYNIMRRPHVFCFIMVAGASSEFMVVMLYWCFSFDSVVPFDLIVHVHFVY